MRLLLVLLYFLVPCAAKDLAWSIESPPIPNPVGVAGAYAGEIDGRLVVAGGANFPEGAPWEGGKKVWHDQIWWQAADGSWRDAGRLPRPLAYGASFSVEGGVLCVGGCDAEEHFDVVYWIEPGADGKLKVSEWPSLPVSLALHAGARLGDKLHILGGSESPEATEASAKHWVFNLASKSWSEAEALPAEGRILPVAGTQAGKLYLFSGASLFADEEGKPTRKPYLKETWCFTPGNGWKRRADAPRSVLAAPSPAFASGASHLIIVGGDDEQNRGFSPLSEHPGFPRDVLAYDVITDTWTEVGELPEPTSSMVTATGVVLGERYWIPSGEIRPGVRSPQVVNLAVVSKREGFGWFNWTVVVLYLSLMVGIGVFFMKREASSTTEAYFRGGQRVPAWVAGLSIFATMLSALTFMGIPARVFQTDMSWYLGQLSILLIVPLVAFCYLPFFRKLDLTSAYEYLEQRFSLACRLFATLSFTAFHLGRIAIVLYLPALALATVSEIDVVTAVVVVGVLCLIYTVIGGIEAVVWTDAIQAIVLLGGALLCFVISAWRIDGGLIGLFETASADNKLLGSLQWNDFSIADGTTSALILFVAFFFNSLVPYTSGQDIVQRYVTTPDLPAARRSLKITMWMSVFGSLLFFVLGAAIYAFYKSHPGNLDPALPATDSILPFFIVHELPVGVSGVVIAAIFAASQSTVSSSLNSVATAFSKDIDARLLRPRASDKAYLRGAQAVVIIAGTLGIGVAVIMAKSEIESAFKTFNSMIGLTAGSLGGLFALGVFTRKANANGAFIGALIGFASVLSLYLSGAPVSGLLYAGIGFLVCFAVGWLLSLLLPGKGDSTLSIFSKNS